MNQTGLDPSTKVAPRLGNLIADADLLTCARKDSFALVAADPGLRKPEHALLRQEVWQRYGKTLDLAEVG